MKDARFCNVQKDFSLFNTADVPRCTQIKVRVHVLCTPIKRPEKRTLRIHGCQYKHAFREKASPFCLRKTGFKKPCRKYHKIALPPVRLFSAVSQKICGAGTGLESNTIPRYYSIRCRRVGSGRLFIFNNASAFECFQGDSNSPFLLRSPVYR